MSEAAAIYERELPVSVERIWENVLDWEHLPHLHSQAFTSIRVVSSDADGWRAEVGIPSSPHETVGVDVRLDRGNLRYTTRTISGSGAGTEILTTLMPRAERHTGIRVEFVLPWAPDAARASIGEAYRGLYVGLWDQDEAMMVERQRVLDAAGSARPATIALGRAGELASRLPLDVDANGRRYRIVSIDGRLVAYDTRCPHLGGPLGHAGSACGNGDALAGDCELVCPWHGYRFDMASGSSSDGRGLRMGRPATVSVSACDGEVTLVLP